MRFPLKKTQTLTGSRISIPSIVTRIKHESQPFNLHSGLILSASRMGQWGVVIFSFFIVHSLFLIRPVYAIVDPLSSPNNKFGVHIIAPTPDESSPAAQLVNSSGGDWGYVTLLIERKDQNVDKWQTFFNDLRRRHLIPLVRIATQPEGAVWKRPAEGEETAWADFLDSLNWPVKNRYVIVYNEPNHGQEWEGSVDPESYARVLDKTVTALKSKNPDFFVLNAGFDASTPQKPPSYMDEWVFLTRMDQEIPGIFNKLDGWVSHSYPNPGFSGSPDSYGRGTIRTFSWELQKLSELGVTKDLPVFITETGWKHAEGLNFDKSLPTAETVGRYLQKAFKEAWNNAKVVAVTPFLLDYQQTPFDHFSFKKINSGLQNLNVLGLNLETSFPKYYPHYETVVAMGKSSGKPVQEKRSSLISGEVYRSIVAGETYTIPLMFKNTGQSIWNEYEPVRIVAVKGGLELGIIPVEIPKDQKIEPGKEFTFQVRLKAPQSGTFEVALQLFEGDKIFDGDPLTFTTEVKSPVILSIGASLPWKESFAGDYLLNFASGFLNASTKVTLNGQGKSEPMEARYLLPDYTFDFTLQKPFYKPKTIQAKVVSGINNLDFGTLDPDFLSALLNPKELWNLLPFSR